ncbi:hypothetical protein B0T13DRAFT_28095 [Neurospora crassa]|nr:hypothetical protein B0T13DRAFT_28095 [Neurospora crassa]
MERAPCCLLWPFRFSLCTVSKAKFGGRSWSWNPSLHSKVPSVAVIHSFNGPDGRWTCDDHQVKTANVLKYKGSSISPRAELIECTLPVNGGTSLLATYHKVVLESGEPSRVKIEVGVLLTRSHPKHLCGLWAVGTPCHSAYTRRVV